MGNKVGKTESSLIFLEKWWELTYEKAFIYHDVKKAELETSLAVQWLRLHASSAGGMGSIPGRGTKIPQATQEQSN